MNEIDRFLPCSPELGRYMAKEHQLARQEHSGTMVFCFSFSLWLAFRFHAPKWERTAYGSANAWRDAEETARVMRGTPWVLSASGQQTESSGVSCTNRLLRPSRIIKWGFHLLVRWSRMHSRCRSLPGFLPSAAECNSAFLPALASAQCHLALLSSGMEPSLWF